MLEVIEYILHHFSLPVTPFTIGVLVLIVLYLTGIVVLLVLLPVNKRMSNYRVAREKRLRKRAEDIIFSWVGEEKTFEETIEALRGVMAKKHYGPWVLIQMFYDFTTIFKGKTLEDFQAYFFELRLDVLSINKLKWNAWKDKAVVLRLLGQMKVNDAIETLLYQALKKDKLYQADSLAALMELGNYDWIDTFSFYQRAVSDMDQMLILEKISNNEALSSEMVSKFLKSENPDIVVIGIRMVYLYNHFGLIDEVVAHLNHNHEKVRFVVLQMLKLQGADGYEEPLIKFLNRANPDETVMVLNIMAFNPEVIDRSVLDDFLKSWHPLIRYSAMRLFYFRGDNFNKKNLTGEEDVMLHSLAHESLAE